MDMPQTKSSFILSFKEARLGRAGSAGGSSSAELSPGSKVGMTSLETGRAASWIHMGAAACFCFTHRADGVLVGQEPKHSKHLCCTSWCDGRKRLYQVLFLFVFKWARVWWQAHHPTQNTGTWSRVLRTQHCTSPPRNFCSLLIFLCCLVSKSVQPHGCAHSYPLYAKL